MANKKVIKINPKPKTKAEATTGGTKTMADKKATKVDSKPVTKVDTSTTGGKGTVKLQDLKPIEMTVEAFKALDAKGLHAKMCTEPQSRISRERGIVFLVDRVGAEKINSITPEMIMSWTYKAVTIEGVTIDDQGFTPATAKKTLTKDAFNKLDAKGKAALIKEYTHKRRAADIVLPDLILKGMPLTGEDVVYLTCGRVAIEGITIVAKAQQAHAITDGVTFS